MNLTVIITALIILAIFVVPFYLISRGNKKEEAEGVMPSGSVQQDIPGPRKEKPSAKKAQSKG